jgi:hypothetical protein
VSSAGELEPIDVVLTELVRLSGAGPVDIPLTRDSVITVIRAIKLAVERADIQRLSILRLTELLLANPLEGERLKSLAQVVKMLGSTEIVVALLAAGVPVEELPPLLGALRR